MTDTEVYRQMFRARIRGDEVAVAKAIRDRTYHVCPWKTWQQLWFDFQQVKKEDEALKLGIMKDETVQQTTTHARF